MWLLRAGRACVWSQKPVFSRIIGGYPTRRFNSNNSNTPMTERIEAPEYLVQLARSVFNKLDKNQNGMLDKQEIEAALAENKFDSRIIDKVMAATDTNHDNMVSFKEFFEGMRYLWGIDKKVHSLVEMQLASCATHKDRPLFGKNVDGMFQYSTYGQFGYDVSLCMGGLSTLDIGDGDAVGVISNNRHEWAVAAYASYGLGARFVPMYEQQQPSDWEFILNDASVQVVFVSTKKIQDLILQMIPNIKSLRKVVCFDAPIDNHASFKALLKNGEKVSAECMYIPTEDTIADIIYTSGTTGRPKGVLLSHGNILSNILSLEPIFPLSDHDRSLSFLPWAHSFGQTCELHAMIRAGAAIAVASDVTNLVHEMSLVHPTILFSVPQVFNRIQVGINSAVSKSAVKSKLFHWSINAAKDYAEAGAHPSSLVKFKHQLGDKLVLSRVRDRFGGNLRAAICGGAPLSPVSALFMERLGIPVYEGYGLTETAPIVACNSPGAHRLGTVGHAIPGVSVFTCDPEGRILPTGQEGELYVCGANVMKGYHNNPEETKKVIVDVEGMKAFRTGDLAVIGEDGFITITGRAKDLFKIANGKYVTPGPIEDAVKLNPLIQQSFVHGDGFAVYMLVVPDMSMVKKWAKDQSIAIDGVLQHPTFLQMMQDIITNSCSHLPHYMVPAKWKIITEPFTVENGLATPKLSLKRKKIESKFKRELSAMSQEFQQLGHHQATIRATNNIS